MRGLRRRMGLALGPGRMRVLRRVGKCRASGPVEAGGEGDAQAGISGQDWRALSAALRLWDFGQARPLSHLGWLDPLVHWAWALLV